MVHNNSCISGWTWTTMPYFQARDRQDSHDRQGGMKYEVDSQLIVEKPKEAQDTARRS